MPIADNEILRGYRWNYPFLFEDYEINQTRDKMIDLTDKFFKELEERETNQI